MKLDRRLRGWIAVTTGFVLPAIGADQFNLPVPQGSRSFGKEVKFLPNGNFIVTDPGYDLPGGARNVGAVYLYGPNGTQISQLTGSTQNDEVGSGGVFIVGDGNFVVRSKHWSNGNQHDAGAVTWISGSEGLSGIVTPQNSLVGTKANDAVGSAGTLHGGITLLANGHYTVSSQDWGNGTANSVGAVTWGNGNAGVTGAVSAENSIVGSQLNDQIGRYRVKPLSNGSYVFRSPKWDNGPVSDAGAVTWARADGGTVGVVSAMNSLVGTSANDQVVFSMITVAESPLFQTEITWSIRRYGIMTVNQMSARSPGGVERLAARGLLLPQIPSWEDRLTT